jgi:hypothetical protein
LLHDGTLASLRRGRLLLEVLSESDHCRVLDHSHIIPDIRLSSLIVSAARTLVIDCRDLSHNWLSGGRVVSKVDHGSSELASFEVVRGTRGSWTRVLF